MPMARTRMVSPRLSDSALYSTSSGIIPCVPADALSQFKYRPSRLSFSISNWNSTTPCPGPFSNEDAKGCSVHLPQISLRQTLANAESDPSFSAITVNLAVPPTLESSERVASTTLMWAPLLGWTVNQKVTLVEYLSNKMITISSTNNSFVY